MYLTNFMLMWISRNNFIVKHNFAVAIYTTMVILGITDTANRSRRKGRDMAAHRTPDQWKSVRPEAVLAGSDAQARNVMHMMRDDLVYLGSALQCVASAAEDQDLEGVIRIAQRALSANPDKPLSKQ